MIGIITADVVGSTKIPNAQRGMLPEVLQKLVAQLQTISPLRLEIYRGDSFQVEVEKFEKAPLIASLLRLGLMKESIDAFNKLDVRVSIGVGEVSYKGESVGQSDGEAYVLSGREFENIGKRRLKIKTSKSYKNDELNVLGIILDDLLTSMTVAQSKVVYETLYNPSITQKAIAEKLSVAPQTINKALYSSKAFLVEIVLIRMETVLVK